MLHRLRFVVLLLVSLGLISLLWLGLKDDSAETADSPSAPERAVMNPDARHRSVRGSTDTPDSVSVSVSGRVLGAEDRALPGAVVTMVSHADTSEPVSVTADEAGRWQSELAPGRWAISATVAGHLPQVLPEVEIEHDGPSIVLRLRPGGHRVSGTVVDVTGGPIASVLVRATPIAGVVDLREHEGTGTLTDDEGAFAVNLATGSYRLDVSHPDYAPASRTVEVGPTTARQRFELVPTGVLEGVVRSEVDGAPVAGARVHWAREGQMRMPEGESMLVALAQGTVRADEAGRFRIRGIEPGEVELTARASSLATAHPTRVVVGIAEHRDDLEVWVAAAHDLEGRVVAAGPSQTPIEGAQVQLLADGPVGHGVTTDGNGRFRIEGVLAGTYGLSASADGYVRPFPEPRISVDGDEHDIVLELGRGPTIQGRTQPPTQAEVTLELRPDDMSMGIGVMAAVQQLGQSTRTADDGEFELGPVQPGRVTLVARTAEGEVGEVSVQISAEGARDIVIPLQRRATVSGRVTDLNGQTLEGAVVTLRPVRADGADMQLSINGKDMGVHTGTATDTGRFEIAGVAAGLHTVSLTDRYGDPLPLQGGTLDPKAPTLKVGEAASVQGVELVVDAHDGVIEGVVVDAEGEPAPDVWVHLRRTQKPEQPEPQPGERQVHRAMILSTSQGAGQQARPPVLTDSEGRFSFTQLHDGQYELMAEADGGGGRVRAPARPGDDVTLQLAALGRIEGVVTLDGQPVTQYLLLVSGPTPRRVSVRDDQGRFEIERLQAGTYTLAVKTGEGTSRAQVEVKAGDEVRRDLSLQQLLAVTGRIVGKDGNPIAGATIMMGTGQDGSIEIRREGDEPDIVTDDEGRFETRVAPGNRVLVALRPDRPQPLTVRFFVAQPGQDVELGDVMERDLPEAEARQ